MTLVFTEDEKKYIIQTADKRYGLKCRDDAPGKIKESITRKIEAHKKWIDSGGTYC